MRASAKGIYQILKQVYCIEDGGTNQAFGKEYISQEVIKIFPNTIWDKDIYYPFMIRDVRKWENLKDSFNIPMNLNKKEERKWKEEHYEEEFEKYLKSGRIPLMLDRDVKAYRLPSKLKLFEQLNKESIERHATVIEDKMKNITIKGGSMKEIEWKKYFPQLIFEEEKINHEDI